MKNEENVIESNTDIAINLFLCVRMCWQLLFWCRMPSMAQVLHSPANLQFRILQSDGMVFLVILVAYDITILML